MLRLARGCFYVLFLTGAAADGSSHDFVGKITAQGNIDAHYH